MLHNKALWQISTCSIFLFYIFRSFRSAGVLLRIFEILLLKSLLQVHNNTATSTAENYIMHKNDFFLSFL